MTVLEEPSAFTPKPIGFDWPRLRGLWALCLMLVCAGLAGAIGYGGQLGYAALMGLAGIASLPMLGVNRAPMLEIASLLAVAVWACITMQWSIAAPAHPNFHRYKEIEGITALKLVLEVGLYGAFLFLMRELPESWAGRIMATLSVGLIIFAVLMAIDALSGQVVYRALRLSAHAEGKPEMIASKAARGTYTLALLFWPAALWMRRVGWNAPLLVFVLGFLVACVGLNVAAPLAAAVLGGVAFFAVRRFGRAAIWVLLIGTIAYFALAPLMIDTFGRFAPPMHNTVGVAKESWGARVAIWRFTADRIAERPLWGWGMDASRMFDPIPLHPHNAALQVWLELGMAGVALAALFWTGLWGRLGTLALHSRTEAGIGAAVAVAYLVIGALSFGVWQEWWLALGALAIAVCWTFSLAFREWEEGALKGSGPTELIPLG